MNKAGQSALARRSLDERYEKMPSARVFTPPTRGWIAAVRTALGMSYRQLAARLGKHPTAIRQLEQSEVRGTIQLSSLRRVAEAMNCTLVYSLVPNESLETAVQKRAREIARRQLEAVGHTMRLEQQSVSPKALEKQLDLFARSISPRVLWDD